jgi:RHS repeat-associated protein
MVGPGTSQEIFAGDSVTLSISGKYLEQRKQKVNVASFAPVGGKTVLLDQLNELVLNTSRAGGANPIALLNLVDILAKDLQRKEVPEAYLIYALYDQDSNRYEVGKKVLSRNAANQHEVLEEKLAIKKNGYLETFVVNETAQDVWFDNFRILSTGSLLVQETHYDPWGLELTGLGYQYAGVKVNKYLYNGKELIEDNGLQYYDYGARMYDASIGRWGVVDPMADLAPGLTPYRYGFNNPLKYTDPTGMFEYSDGYSTQDSRNSTGSMSFSGTYEYRTINTDLITFQHGENAPVSGGYIESYVKETGSVTGRSYFGSSPNLFGAGGFGDMGGHSQGSGGTDWSAIGNALTGGGIAYYNLEKSINNSKYWVDAKGSIKSKELLKQGSMVNMLEAFRG